MFQLQLNLLPDLCDLEIVNATDLNPPLIFSAFIASMLQTQEPLMSIAAPLDYRASQPPCIHLRTRSWSLGLFAKPGHTKLSQLDLTAPT